MRILVTGGAGFIGSHVVDAYIAAGHEVGILDNCSTSTEANLNPAAEAHRVDLRDEPSVEKVIASFRPDIVNHHAAQSEVPKSVADPTYDAQVNIIGGLNLLKASVDHAVKKVIFISTGGALYGEPDVVPADEDHPVRPLSPYGTSKYCFEQYLGTFKRTFGLEFTVLRYANVYGPRQDFHAEEGRVVAIFASRMLEGKPVTIDGDGEQSRGWTYVSDVVDATVLAMEGGSGTYNVGGAHEVSIREAIAQFERISGRTLDVREHPAVPGDQRRTNADTTRIRSELGWEPRVGVEEGLQAEWDWACARVAAR